MKYLNNLFILLILLTITLSSCTEENCEISGTCPEGNALGVIERIDIKTVDSETHFYFQESIEENITTDLISFNYYGTPSNKIDFKIKLANDIILIVKLHNRKKTNPWEYDNESYGFFATQDLDNKYQYVTVEMINQENFESPIYSSSIGIQSHLGGHLDVFRIENVDIQNKEIHCRINKMFLYKIGNPSKTMEINGTFRAALTFL